jgi:adenylate kinase
LHLIFIGAPGSGKGTQAEKLKNNPGYKHVSTGDLLRAEVSSGSSLGNQVKDLISDGGLVDDDTVLDLFKNNLNLSEFEYIIDGFPRTLNQCKLLDKCLLNRVDYRAIYFEINVSDVVNRIINRRVAIESGKIYNLVSDPPEIPGICDVSGEALIHREDDKEDVVLKRIEIYKNGISEILSYYAKSDKLLTLDASKGADIVYKELLKIVN